MDPVQVRKRAQAFVPEGTVRFAFVGGRGLRTGVALLAFPVLLVGLLIPVGPQLGREVVTVVLAIGVSWGILASRRFYTIALTDDAVVLIRNHRLRSAEPDALERTLPATTPFEFADEGDASVRIDGVRYWVMGASEDEARRAAALHTTR